MANDPLVVSEEDRLAFADLFELPQHNAADLFAGKHDDKPNIMRGLQILARHAEAARLATRNEVEAERDELNALCAKVEADAVSGLRYIERRYGRLEGVGWDRVFDAHDELFRRGAQALVNPR